MKREKYIVRLLQTLTSITVVVIIALVLAIFNVVSIPGIRPADAGKPTELKRVKRPVGLQKNSAYQEDYEQKGDIYLTQKDYTQAKRNFELVRSLDPANPRIPIKIIKSLLGLRKAIDAQVELEKIQPETQESAYYKGLIAAFLNEPDTAKDLLAKSLSLGTDEIIKTNSQRILTIYKEFEMSRGAEMEFLQAMLAQAFDQAEEYGLAIELAFNALKTKHDYRDCWIILGHAFLNERKWLDAEDALAKAIQLDASHPAAYFFRGIAKKNLQKIPEAQADFEEALDLGWKPQILVKFELAEIYFSLEDFADAFSFYKDVVLSDPSDISRFTRPMALAINELNKPKEALELAKAALKAHPDAAMGYNLLGWAAIANNDFASARKNLKEALKRDPELDAAYLNSGLLAEREGKRTEALENYKKAQSLAEKSGDQSVANAASSKSSELMKAPAGPAAQIPQSAPQSQYIPSLSLL